MVISTFLVGNDVTKSSKDVFKGFYDVIKSSNDVIEGFDDDFGYFKGLHSFFNDVINLLMSLKALIDLI
jgi:hypothetical protein